MSLTSPTLLVERSKCSKGKLERQPKLLSSLKLLLDNSKCFKAVKFSRPEMSYKPLLFKFIFVICAITSGSIDIDFAVSL